MSYYVLLFCQYIFTLSTKIAYDHSKRPKKDTTFPQINMLVVHGFVVVIFDSV